MHSMTSYRQGNKSTNAENSWLSAQTGVREFENYKLHELPFPE
jgi:hypothetical protein